MTDKTAPKLINFNLPKTIDLSQPGAKISFQVEAADEAGGSGLNSVLIFLDRFVSGGSLIKHVGLRPGVGSADGQLVATDTFNDATPTTAAVDFNVGAGSPPGTVRVETLMVLDKDGNVSSYNSAQLEALGFNSTIQLVNGSAPAAPTAFLGNSDSTNPAVRKFEGMAQPGQKIFMSAYVDGAWKNLGSSTAGADGKWTLQTAPLTDGVYTKTSAWAVDSQGNASAISQQFAFDVWKEGLGTPKLILPLDSQGFLLTDNPVVTGSGLPRATVTLFADGKAIGTGTVDDGGFWAIVANTLTGGVHTFTASQATAGGQTSALSLPLQGNVVVTAGGVKFAVKSVVAGSSNADTEYIQNMLDDAAARFSEFIDADITVPVNVTIKDMGTAVGSAGAHWMGTDGTGTPMLGEAVLNLNSKHAGLYSAVGAANPYLYGHEMLHVLGFNSSASAFQKYVKVQSDGIYFVGPNAVALNGAPIRLDSSQSHIDGDSDLMGSGGGSLANPVFGEANPFAPFSQLDIAMLKDLGWTTKPVLVSSDGHTFIAGSGKAGFDRVAGTSGLDTFFINQSQSAFTGKWVDGAYVLSNSANGTSHTLNGIERIKFADATVALDVDGAGGQMYRLYQAVFGRTPDAGGLGFWIKGLDNGMTLSQAADMFVTSNEFKTLYGVNPTPEEIVTKLYANVLHRAPDKGGFDFWLPIIQRDPTLVEEVVVAFSESPENKEQVAKIIGNGFQYDPWA